MDIVLPLQRRNKCNRKRFLHFVKSMLNKLRFLFYCVIVRRSFGSFCTVVC